MAKQVGQIRWFGANNSSNSSKSLTLNDLIRGTMLPKTYPITAITIQAPRGSQIFINSNSQPITLGTTQIYSLDVEGVAIITSVRFSLDTINKISNAAVVIDYTYETT